LAQFCPELERVLLDELKAQGVLFHRDHLRAWEGHPRASKAHLGQGSSLDFDVALTATGIAPSTNWFKDLRLRRGERGGVWVDRWGQSSIPGIWAAGDCCELPHKTGGSSRYLPFAQSAAQMGQIIAQKLLGENPQPHNQLTNLAFRFFNWQLAHIGECSGGCFQHSWQGYNRPAYVQNRLPIFIHLVWDRHEHLQGAQIAGQEGVVALADLLAIAISQGIKLGELERLSGAYAPSLSSLWPVLAQAARSAKRVSSSLWKR